MSGQIGFVITVFCEEFFEDARKSVALFFHKERMKTVQDLKERLKSLVRKDFHILWSPHDEESYHYLLDDEELHFVKPKDKFRICKTKKSSTNDLIKKEITVSENNTTSSEGNVVDDKVYSNHATNGTNETTKDIPSDDPMEYEDIVDQGINNKKRKRIRKHKSKKQKLENSTIKAEIVYLTNGFELAHEPVLLNDYFEKNNGSHIRFQGEVSGTDQVDSKQENETENIWYNVENIETIKKKKNKSKKTKLESSHEASIQFNEQDNFDIRQSGKTSSSTVPSTVEETSELARQNSSTTHMVTSTAVNSPVSIVKKPSRKTYTQSLAGFIDRLSESLKHQPKANEFTDDSNISEINKATSPSSKNPNDDVPVINNETPCSTSKQLEKFSPHVTKLINSIKKSKVLSQEQKPSESVEANNIQYSDRKLRLLKNQSNLNQTKTIQDPFTVLDNLKQLKFANYTNMPLIFERKNLQRECVSKKNGSEEIANETDVPELNETVKQNGCPVATNGFGNIEQGACPVAIDEFGDIHQTVSRVRTMTNQEISMLPVVKDPKENDVILFKILKMDESYNPSLSSYVCAKVNSICSLSSQLYLHILHGAEELKPPVGKFSLEEEDERTENEELFEHSINWNEIYDSRLLFGQETS